MYCFAEGAILGVHVLDGLPGVVGEQMELNWQPGKASKHPSVAIRAKLLSSFGAY